MADEYRTQPTSDAEMLQALGRPSVEQMVQPGLPQRPQTDFLQALAKYEQAVNMALQYLQQPVGQSTPPPGLTAPGAPTPQQLMRQGPMGPSALPAPPQMASAIAARPPMPQALPLRMPMVMPATTPPNPLLQLQGGIVNTDTGRAVPMPTPKPDIPPRVERANAKLRDSEQKRKKTFRAGPKANPLDEPYKGGGDPEAARKTRQQFSIDRLFRP
jgi:hypothetical protein